MEVNLPVPLWTCRKLDSSTAVIENEPIVRGIDDPAAYGNSSASCIGRADVGDGSDLYASHNAFHDHGRGDRQQSDCNQEFAAQFGTSSLQVIEYLPSRFSAANLRRRTLTARRVQAIIQMAWTENWRVS